jgi:hypothetical protein
LELEWVRLHELHILALGGLLLEGIDLEATRPVVSKRAWDVTPLVDEVLLQRSICLDAVVCLCVVRGSHQKDHQEKVRAERE